MQGGQPYLQAQINQQLDDHACDTLRFAPEQRMHGTAIKTGSRRRGAGSTGWGDEFPAHMLLPHVYLGLSVEPQQ